MHKAFLARGNLHKRAEVHDSRHAAAVIGARLRVVDDGIDDVHSAAALFNVYARNIAVAVILDIDGNVALGADLLNDLAAGADDLADLIDRHDGGQHLRCILGKLGTRLCDNRQHNFVQNVISCFVRLCKRFLDDLRRETVNLQVHLNGGDALLCTGNLKVHIAEEILKALNIDHGHPAAALGDEAAGNTGDRRFNRHACVHQCQRRAADGALRRGTVRGKHLGNQTDGVRELLDRRDDRHKCTLCQCAVTDFTSARASGGLRLAYGIGREVVVVDVALGLFVIDAVKELVVTRGAERCNGKYLRLAAGEHAGAVYARQQTDFCGKRTDLIHTSAVNTLLLVEQPAAHDKLLRQIHALVDLCRLIWVNFVEVLVHFFVNRLESLVANGLVVRIECGLHVINGEIADFFEHLRVRLIGRVRELLFADLPLDTLDELDDFLVFRMTCHNAVEHILVGHFVCTGFDHCDALIGGSDGNSHLGELSLLCRRVDDELAVDEADGNAADGAVPRNVGDGQRDAGADECGNLRGAIRVNGHDGADDGNIVAHVLREQRADGAVDHTADKNRLIGRATLTL